MKNMVIFIQKSYDRGINMKNRGKKIGILLLVFILLAITLNSYAHSGRTDVNGGHKDNKNKSGLGSYHYHCGGNPAHLHSNGVCPYFTSNTKKTTTTTKNSSNSNKTNTTKNIVKTVEAEKIVIEILKKELEIGETLNAKVFITPHNVTNKQVNWSSSDEKIASVDKEGKILAKSDGKVTIKAKTSNGKEDHIEIIIKKVKVEELDIQKEKNEPIKTIPVVSNSTSQDPDTEATNPIAMLGAIVILGGGGFFGYQKYKNSKKS